MKHVLTLIVASAILILAFRSLASHDPNFHEETDPIPIALNHILSNDISDFDSAAKMDSQIESFMRQWGIKGASLAIMKDEKLIYAKGYGWADQEAGERTDVRHIFRIASISKLITAAAVMKLSQEGLLSLDSKVFDKGGALYNRFGRDIEDSRLKTITIEHLLRHRAGFTNRIGDPMFNLTTIASRIGIDRAPSTDEIIKWAMSQRLGYTPGRGTRYSNLGYLILSKIIEEVTGTSYEDYVVKEILNVAGIYDMHIAKNLYEEKYPNEVRYYYPQDEEPILSYDGSGRYLPRCYGGNSIEALQGAGAWVASPAELLKFVAAIDGRDSVNDILSSESVEKMTLSSSSELPIGWARCTPAGDWTRTGTLSGTSALLKYNRDGYSWVFVTNTSSWKGSDFPRQIDAMFRKAFSRVQEWPERDLFETKTL